MIRVLGVPVCGALLKCRLTKKLWAHLIMRPFLSYKLAYANRAAVRTLSH
jgi:hypothetical protein